MSIAVLAGLMWYTGTPVNELLSTLGSLSPWAYLGALSFHLSTYSLRALRFSVLIPAQIRPKYRRIWILSGAHNLASYVLPAKTGEASWVVYLRTYTGVPSAPGIASLVVSRLLDAAVLACSISLACMYLGTVGDHGHLEEIAKYVAPLAIIGVAAAAIAVRGDLLVHLLSKTMRYMKVHHWELGERLVEKITQIAHAMRRASKGHSLGVAALLTIPVWLGIFGFYWLLARGMDIDFGRDPGLSFPEAVFGSSFAVFANLLPVNGAAGVGTQEAGWVTGFVLLSVEQTRALSVGLAVHLVQLFNVVAVGMFSHFIMKGMIKPARMDIEALEAESAELEAELDADLQMESGAALPEKPPTRVD